MLKYHNPSKIIAVITPSIFLLAQLSACELKDTEEFCITMMVDMLTFNIVFEQSIYDEMAEDDTIEIRLETGSVVESLTKAQYLEEKIEDKFADRKVHTYNIEYMREKRSYWVKAYLKFGDREGIKRRLFIPKKDYCNGELGEQDALLSFYPVE